MGLCSYRERRLFCEQLRLLTLSIVDYSCIMSGKVLGSLLGADKFRIADASALAIVIQHDIKHILQKLLMVKILTDIETWFNVIFRNP